MRSLYPQTAGSEADNEDDDRKQRVSAPAIGSVSPCRQPLASWADIRTPLSRRFPESESADPQAPLTDIFSAKAGPEDYAKQLKQAGIACKKKGVLRQVLHLSGGPLFNQEFLARYKAGLKSLPELLNSHPDEVFWRCNYDQLKQTLLEADKPSSARLARRSSTSSATKRSDGTRPYQVFISFRVGEAKQHAELLHEALNSLGIRVFVCTQSMIAGQSMPRHIFEEGMQQAPVGLVLATKTYATATPSPYCTPNELVLLMKSKKMVVVKMHDGELDMLFGELVTELTSRLEWLPMHGWEEKVKQVVAAVVRRLLCAELGYQD